MNIPVVFFTEEGMVANANFMKELREAVPERNRSIIMASTIIMSDPVCMREKESDS